MHANQWFMSLLSGCSKKFLMILEYFRITDLVVLTL
jgi:hypothetical protein